MMVSNAMGEMNSLRNLPSQSIQRHLKIPCSLDLLTFAASNQAGSGEPSGSATSVELVTGLSQNYSTRPPDLKGLDHKVDEIGIPVQW